MHVEDYLFLETSVQPCVCVSVSACVIVASVTPQLKLTNRNKGGRNDITDK